MHAAMPALNVDSHPNGRTVFGIPTAGHRPDQPPVWKRISTSGGAQSSRGPDENPLATCPKSQSTFKVGVRAAFPTVNSRGALSICGTLCPHLDAARAVTCRAGRLLRALVVGVQIAPGASPTEASVSTEDIAFFPPRGPDRGITCRPESATGPHSEVAQKALQLA